MTPPKTKTGPLANGYVFALAAFIFWGLLQPYFFGAFDGIPALVVAAHRTLWSCLFIWIWLALRGKLGSALGLFGDAKTVLILLITGLLITSNWSIYIFAVLEGRLIDASIGYFMTPLMTALFGILILGERPRRLQLWALALAAIGVVSYTLLLGVLPLIALSLSLTFSAYGGIRKLYRVPAERGMALETTLLAPVALILILGWGWAGAPYFLSSSGLQAGLLIVAGLVTLLPLVWYNAAAARMPLLSLGLMQFIVPFSLLALSLLPPLSEALDEPKALMLGCIWIALIFYVWDLVSHARRSSAPA